MSYRHPVATRGPGIGRLGNYRPVGPLTADPSGLVATAAAVCELDWTEVSLHVVLAPLDAAARRRLRSEAADLTTALAGLNGGALVPLFDHCTDSQGRLVLITGRMVGTLADELATAGPLPLDVVLGAAGSAAAGLGVLHQVGLVHRGVSPAALVRRPDGQLILGCPPLPVLVEFAAATTDGTGHEPAEVLSGGDWTPGAEVYALASTLWTLLAGRPPAGGSRAEQLARLLGGDLPRLRRTDVPESIQAGLRAGLALDPADRPAGATALATLLADAARVDRVRVDRVGLVTMPPNHPIEPARSSARPLGARYLLEAKIGAGSSGTVWRARRRDDGSVFAAKLLRPEFADDRATVARLLTERATLLRLSHPHLVTVHDLVAEAGELAIVMDLVEGEDLRSLLTGRTVGRGTGVRLLAEVAAALAAVHGAGVVHRDVKPENVLVTRGTPRRARLTDFGLAKALDSPTLTRQSQLLGTPAYLAPELVAGREAEPAADVYSLGIILFELFAGRRPFHEPNTAALLRAHLEQQPVRPAGLPGPLWQLVSGCLDKQPARRPTAGLLAAELRRLEALVDDDAPPDADESAPIAVLPVAQVTGAQVTGADRPTVSAADPRAPGGQFEFQPTAASVRPPPVRPPPQAPRRRRWPLITAALSTVVLGLVIGVWLVGPSDQPVAPPPSQAQSGESQARYVIPVSAVVGADGQVVLSWSAGAEQLDGFRGYLVLRDKQPTTDNPLLRGETTFVDLAARSGSCYEVIAIGVPGTPPDPPPPACPAFAEPS